MKKASKHPITNPTKPTSSAQGKANPNAYLKYSGMAFQMGAIILVGALAGRKLDVYLQNSKPWATVGLSLLAIFAALYLTLKDLIKKEEK
jgi:F0F1-type ATP synthase assembly protein I